MKRPLIKTIILLYLVSMISLSCGLLGEKAAAAEEPSPTKTQPSVPSDTSVPSATATTAPEDTASPEPESTEPAAAELFDSGDSHFEYMVSGCQEAIISGSVVEDNSIPIMYTLILLDDSDNALLLYLPIELEDEYFDELVPYEFDNPTWPTVSLYLAPDTYEAQGGIVYIYHEADGSISGNLEFFGTSVDDESCEINVVLNFDHLLLPDM